MKIKLISISLLMFLFSCGSASQSSGEHNHAEGEVHEESHEGHNHGEESHEGHNHEEAADSHTEEAEAHEHQGAITFHSEQAEQLDFQITKVGKHAFKNVVKASGTVDDAQGDENVVVATASGTVMFDSKRMTEGAAVKKGQSLVVIQSSDLTDDNLSQRIAEARADKNLADSNLKRAEELAGDAVSEKEIASLKLAAEQAQIKLGTLTKNVSARGKSIVSPAGGYVKNVLVREGQYVAVGEPIMTISKNNRIQLRAEVALKDYDKLKAGDLNAKIVVPYNNKSYDLSSLGGKVVSVGKVASGSFYVPVTFEFENRGDIIPGGYVEVYIMSGNSDEQIVIPYSSLVEEQGVYSVYVKVCDESYEKRYVKIGNHNSEDVVILNGLKEGDDVVSRGAYFVKLAAVSAAVPAHSHEH